MIRLLVVAVLAQPAPAQCPNRASVLRAGDVAPCAGVLISKTMADRAVKAKADAQACAIMRDAEAQVARMRLAWAAAAAQVRQAALLRSTERVVEQPEAPRPWYLNPMLIGLAAGAAGAAGGYLLR